MAIRKPAHTTKPPRGVIPRATPQPPRAGPGPGDVLRRIVRQAAMTVGAAQAFIALRDSNDPATLAIAATHGREAEELPGRRFSLDEGLAGRVVAENTPLVLGGGRRFARDEIGTLTPVRAAAAVPLRAGGRVRGALAVASTQPGRDFDEHDLELLDGLAALAAT